MIAIARNEASLAHGAARNAHASLTDTDDRHFVKVRLARNVRGFVAALRKHFGDRLLGLHVLRATGGRAFAGALMLDATMCGAGFVPVVLRFQGKPPAGQKVTTWTAPVLITRHALARLFQRSTGSTDIAEACRCISEHVGAAVNWTINTSRCRSAKSSSLVTAARCWARSRRAACCCAPGWMPSPHRTRPGGEPHWLRKFLRGSCRSRRCNFVMNTVGNCCSCVKPDLEFCLLEPSLRLV